MDGSYFASRPGFLVCPYCEAGKLCPSSHVSSHCDSCGGFLSGTILEVLREIAALPNHTRDHPPECGHPQMRLFPNGVVYCLVCWS